MYCPSSLHDSVSKHKSMDTLKNIWLDIVSKTSHKNLKYKIAFTGGEVTGNKNFLPFVKWLRGTYDQHIDKILLTTNGSAGFAYYKHLLTLVNNVSFTTHSEHINEKKFFDTVCRLQSVLNTHNHIHVNIMDEWWNKDRIQHYCKILSDNKVSFSVNQIDWSQQTRSTPILKGKLNLATSYTHVL